MEIIWGFSSLSQIKWVSSTMTLFVLLLLLLLFLRCRSALKHCPGKHKEEEKSVILDDTHLIYPLGILDVLDIQHMLKKAGEQPAIL